MHCSNSAAACTAGHAFRPCSAARCASAAAKACPARPGTQGRPIVLLKHFERSYFRRTAAGACRGLTCGIALPIFAGDTLNAVLVIFCGDDEDHAGAIELWHNDPAESKDMTLDDGYYGTTADAFEFMSRRTSFRKGIGLPGPGLGLGHAGVPARPGQGRPLPARRQRRQGRHQPRLRDALRQPRRRALSCWPSCRRWRRRSCAGFEVWSPAGSDGALLPRRRLLRGAGPAGARRPTPPSQRPGRARPRLPDRRCRC